jgi:hypothetical protein
VLLVQWELNFSKTLSKTQSRWRKSARVFDAFLPPHKGQEGAEGCFLFQVFSSGT